MRDPTADSETDGHETVRCPECGANSHDLCHRTGRSDIAASQLRGDPDARWRCSQCEACFDEPEREQQRYSPPGQSSSLGQRLVEMDSEEFPPEDGGESDG